MKKIRQLIIQSAILALFFYVAYRELGGGASNDGGVSSTASVLDGNQAEKMFLDLGGSPGKLPVVMFATSWCGVCQALGAELTQRGVDHIRVDIEANRVAGLYYQRLTRGQGGAVPLTAVGNKVFLGYNLKAILGAIAELSMAFPDNAQLTANPVLSTFDPEV